MNQTDKDRADFEAKHPVPGGQISYHPESNAYVCINDGEFVYDKCCNEYNILWQGYQLGRAAVQGEAVAWMLTHPSAKRCLMFPYDFTDTNRKTDESKGWSYVPLFTYPQPAQPDPLSIGTAQKEYDECMVEGEEPDPIERLRAFCSFTMEPQDWLDVEKFFDAVIAERTDQWNAAIEAAAEVCERLKWALDHGGNKYHREAKASQCKAAILALRKGEDCYPASAFANPAQPDPWNELYNWLHKELNSSGELMSMAEDTHFRATIKDVIKRMEAVDKSLVLRKECL